MSCSGVATFWRNTMKSVQDFWDFEDVQGSLHGALLSTPLQRQDVYTYTKLLGPTQPTFNILNRSTCIRSGCGFSQTKRVSQCVNLRRSRLGTVRTILDIESLKNFNPERFLAAWPNQLQTICVPNWQTHFVIGTILQARNPLLMGSELFGPQDKFWFLEVAWDFPWTCL